MLTVQDFILTRKDTVLNYEVIMFSFLCKNIINHKNSVSLRVKKIYAYTDNYQYRTGLIVFKKSVCKITILYWFCFNPSLTPKQ